MASITAIIPTLSNVDGLKHLLAELDKAQIKSVVINNASTSPGVAQVDSPGVVVLNPGKNLFFAAAVNLGVKQVETDWLLIANDDIETVIKEKISHMLETATKNKWEAVSPILKSPKGNIENIGYRVLPIGKAELNFNEDNYSDETIDGLTMACLLIKKEVYEQLGGLDESFVAYLEDVDFFLRLKKLGYHFGVDTSIEVLHNHMTTSSTMKGFKQKRDFINWIKVIRKNWDKETLQQYWFKIMIERLRNLKTFLISGI